MAITNFTPGFTLGTITPPKTDWSKGISLGASNKVSLSNPLGDLNIKPETGQNLLGNINIGQLATMALPMVTGALKSVADKPLQNMTPEQRQQFEAIYGSGDSVLGDLFNMKQNVQNSIDNINSNIHTNTGALSSTQALVDSFNNINYDAFKQNNDKMSFGQGLSRIADSAAKGFSTGMATGNPFIGLFSAAANAIGSGARMAFAGKNRNTINNAAELALNKTLDNQSLQAENTQKQMGLTNLANANYAALGGQLNYNIDDKYLANDYMSKLNNRVYKPQFDSMNYFAMGGMPDFNEFNTGGTHEQNPNGGIPQGMDKQGIMNTVEQGETKTTTPEGDYIFSDRLKLSKEECKQLGVPKDSTYAEASKILRKEYDEMPNDEIARKGWEQSRDMLIQSQEMQKQEIALKEARKQGLNSPKMQGIDPQVMQDMYYNENPQEESSLQQGINPNIQNAFGGLFKQMREGGDPDNPPISYYYFDTTPPISIVQNVEDWYNDAQQAFLDTQSKENPNFNKNYYAEQSWNRMQDSLKDSTYNPFTYATYEDFVKDIGLNSNFENNELERSMYLYALDKAKKKNPIWYSKERRVRPDIIDLGGGRSTYDLNTGESVSTDGLGRIYTIKDQKYYPSKQTSTNNNTFNPENFRYAPIAANIVGLAQNLFTPEDYSIPNRLQKEINALPRVSVPKNTNYMTYNPVDVNRYTNQYNAQTAAQRNAIMNTSNPNRNAALASAIYNANIGYGDLVQAIEAQNAKEKQTVQQFNAGIDQQNIANQLQVDNINQQYEQMRINGIMQELAMRDAIQTARANAIQSNLKGLTDNLSGIAQQAENKRMFDVYMAGQGHELTMLQRLANGEDINDLISEWTAGQDENYRKEFIDKLKKNPRYKNYVGQIKQ